MQIVNKLLSLIKSRVREITGLFGIDDSLFIRSMYASLIHCTELITVAAKKGKDGKKRDGKKGDGTNGDDENDYKKDKSPLDLFRMGKKYVSIEYILTVQKHFYEFWLNKAKTRLTYLETKLKFHNYTDKNPKGFYEKNIIITKTGIEWLQTTLNEMNSSGEEINNDGRADK